jgi:hypothetical protein
VDQRKGNVGRINVDSANGEGRTPTGVNPLDPKGSEQVLAGIQDADLRGFVAEYFTRETGPQQVFGDNHGYNADTVSLKLSRGKVALLDREDLARVSEYKWYAAWLHHDWRAVARIGNKTVYLHRFLMNAPAGMEVDHRNGIGLDCRRSNLRICTKSQNGANTFRRPARKKASKFKGVSTVNGKWRARIKVNGVQSHLGVFSTPEAAARAYDEAAARIFGEFARTNFRDDKVA